MLDRLVCEIRPDANVKKATSLPSRKPAFGLMTAALLIWGVDWMNCSISECGDFIGAASELLLESHEEVEQALFRLGLELKTSEGEVLLSPSESLSLDTGAV